METNISLKELLGNDKASATDIPPLKPPQVKIGMAFLSKALPNLKTAMGMATEINLANKTMMMVTQPSQNKV